MHCFRCASDADLRRDHLDTTALTSLTVELALYGTHPGDHAVLILDEHGRLKAAGRAATDEPPVDEWCGRTLTWTLPGGVEMEALRAFVLGHLHLLVRVHDAHRVHESVGVVVVEWGEDGFRASDASERCLRNVLADR